MSDRNYSKLKYLSSENLTDVLEDACEKNDIEMVKYILSSKKIVHQPSLNGRREFRATEKTAISICCTNGHLEILDLMLTLPDIEIRVKDLFYQLNSGFLAACQEGELDIVKYLTSSPNLKRHANPNYNNGEGLCLACREGHLNIVKYLLTSPDIKEKLSVTARKNSPLLEAYTNEHYQTVKYLLISPDLIEHADPHSNGDTLFYHVLNSDNPEMLKFLIFDLNIEKTKEITRILETYNDVEVNNLFELRELNKELNQNLSSNDINIKKAKI